MLVKTKTVSDQLDVNPSTIQRWVKSFELPCHKNNHGHLLFNEKDIEKLQQIKGQLNNGLSMVDVQLYSEEEEPRKTGVCMSDYEKKLKSMVLRMDDVEETLTKKADEVVSIQLYQHRNEIDHLSKTIGEVENRLQTIESQLSSLNAPAHKEKETKEKKPKRNWFVSIFRPEPSQ